MAVSEHNVRGSDESHRKVIIVVAVIAAILIAVLFYLLLRVSGSSSSSQATLQGAVRQGSPEYEQNVSKIVLDESEADEAKRALGDIVMTLYTTVRNFTGRTLDGLELRAAVVDHQGRAVKERTVVVIPGKQPTLEPNKTIFVQVMLEGMSDADDRANIKMEVTGFRFK